MNTINLYEVHKYLDRQKNGSRINRFPVQCINKNELVETVQDAFGYELIDSYLSHLLNDQAIAYCEIDFKGIVVVIPEPADGVPPHIETVAVKKMHQRKGIGSDLMSVVLREHHKCNLRSELIPERRQANDMYLELFGTPQPFKNYQNILYNGYFMDHSESEVKKSIGYMRGRPDAFKKKLRAARRPELGIN